MGSFHKTLQHVIGIRQTTVWSGLQHGADNTF